MFGGAVSSHPVSCREDELCWLQAAFCATLCPQSVPAALVAGARELCNPPAGAGLPPPAERGAGDGEAAGPPGLRVLGTPGRPLCPLRCPGEVPGVLTPGETRGSQSQPQPAVLLAVQSACRGDGAI